MADVVMQVARRCTFGFTPDLYEAVERQGVDGWLNRQLEPNQLRDDMVQTRLALLFPSLLLMSPEQRDNMEGQYRFAIEWRHSLLMRAVESERQLQEVLVHVWLDHFNTSVRELHVAMAKSDEDRFIRANALGRFSEILKGMASMPTMLIFLDSNSNKIPEPNENFARELLELHTLGRGNFDERDVHDAARVFTGWGVRRNKFHFSPNHHDSGPATVAGWSTTGRSGEDGVRDGMLLLDYLSKHPATAQRVSERLVRRFVADDPPADLVEAGALAYRRNTTHIVPVLRTIFRHEAFRLGSATKFQRPFELLAAALRVTGANVDWSPHSASAGELNKRLTELNNLPGEELSPMGYPDRAEAWMGSSDLLRRWELMADIGGGNMRGVRVDPQRLMGSHPSNAGELVDRLSKRLLGRKMNTEQRQALLTFLGRDAGQPVDRNLLSARLGPLVGLILASPDFNYR
jgi:uncharacterized protein (DUF1800 family)